MRSVRLRALLAVALLGALLAPEATAATLALHIVVGHHADHPPQARPDEELSDPHHHPVPDPDFDEAALARGSSSRPPDVPSRKLPPAATVTAGPSFVATLPHRAAPPPRDGSPAPPVPRPRSADVLRI